MNDRIRVVELFAGVGGFRIGLEGWNGKSSTSFYKEDLQSNYEVVWSNQYEPSTKTQHASLVYEHRFGKHNHSNEDITTVEISDIPDHDLLVGGFPCQDYSVATTTKNSKGLIGKKGVLWWSIHKILTEKENKPKYLFLENVDRLLISPTGQKGRDFAIILQSLNELGYIVEWRVINAAEYGFPQRRRRTFILAYHKSTEIYNKIINDSTFDWILNSGTLSKAFPIVLDSSTKLSEFELKGDIINISENFNKKDFTGHFQNTGIMIGGKITTLKTSSNYTGNYILLKDVLEFGTVDSEFYINDKELERWSYLKGYKKIVRTNSQGYEYNYSEGAMGFPDSLDKPSRTIITGEGGNSPSRFKHVIKIDEVYRRLIPLELERLNMFPDDHTKLQGISNTKRAFFMGNALVVGVIEKIGISLNERIYEAKF